MSEGGGRGGRCVLLLLMCEWPRLLACLLISTISPGHAPGPELDFAQNRESYSLTAGLALGMIGLGVSPSFLSLPSFLSTLLVGVENFIRNTAAVVCLNCVYQM